MNNVYFNYVFLLLFRLIFRDLQKLIEIDLSNNRLTSIHPNAFANTTQLETIILKNNHLSFSDHKSPFMHLKNLKLLNLSNNVLTRFPSDLIEMRNLKELDLRFNRITSFKYSELRDTNIKLNSTYEIRLAPESSVLIHLNDNPLVCDCSMYSFLSGKGDQLSTAFVQNCIKSLVHLKPCNSLDDSMKNCPAECRCSKRSDVQGQQILITCEGKGLKTVPKIENEAEHSTSIELDISKNRLTKLPKLPRNSNVIVIQASHNKISYIDVENLPQRLRALDVSHNEIQMISPNVLHHLKNHRNLEIFFFSENPLLCDCSTDTEELMAFAKENNSITDLQNIKCTVSEMSYELSSDFLKEFCLDKLYKELFIYLAVLTFLIGLFAVLFYKYQQFIKVWLYAHNACACWVDEEYLDRDKVYDAFMSYSHLDDDYVNDLVDKLECGSPRFKLCVHERDFVGGEEIEKSVNFNFVSRVRAQDHYSSH